MPWHLFSVFSVFLLLCCAFGPAFAESPAQARGIELFTSERTNALRVGDGQTVVGVQTFSSPLLVGGNGVMAAFAEAYHSESHTANCDIVARYIGTGGTDWVRNVTEGGGKKWATQLAIRQEREQDYVCVRRSSLAVFKDNKIYLLVTKQRRLKENLRSGHADVEFELAVGEVTDNRNQATVKTINWQAPRPLNTTLVEQFKSQSLFVPPSGGASAFLTEDGKIVFLVRTMRGKEHGFAIIHLKQTGDVTQSDWSHIGIVGTCYPQSFFKWKSKLIMIPLYCLDGCLNMKESADMGRTWGDTTGPIVRLLRAFRNKGGFTTVTIENRTVVLFAESRITGHITWNEYTMHLWVTDGNRVHEVGPIVTDDMLLASGTILYTNDELFFLHERWSNGPAGIFFAHLKSELVNIKSVLKTWAEKDAYLSKRCSETALQGASPHALCVTPMPTDGLVGFLSNTASGDVWQDEYLYANATVTGGTKVSHGFTFSGAGAGAEWAVFQRGPSQRYHFIRYGLTVVATVIIHEAPADDSSLLWFGGVGDHERVGLWYGKDGQWRVISDKETLAAGGWEKNRQHTVALVLQRYTVGAYVDGKSVGDSLRILAPWKRSFDIERLFIGGYGGDGGNSESTVNRLTVTDVFLYNRPLSVAELEVLGEKKAAGTIS